MCSSGWLSVAVVLLAFSGVTLAGPPLTESRDEKRIWSTVPAEVDSVTALNARLRGTIRPETNAVVVLVSVLGEDRIPEAVRKEFLRLLGRDPTLGNVPAFQSAEAFARSKANGSTAVERRILEAIVTSLGACEKSFWQTSGHPELSDFLKANDAALDRIIAGSTRPDWYCPIVSASDPPRLLDASDPFVHELRGIVRMLATRANFRGGSRNAEGAIADLMAIRRLAVLIARNPHWSVALMGAGIVDYYAYRSEALLLESDVLTAGQAKAYSVALQRLPSFLSSAEVFERDRFLVDGHITRFRDGIEIGAPEDAPTEELKILKERHRAKLPGPRWDVVRDHAQRIFSDYVRVVRMTDQRQFEAEIARLDKAFEVYEARQKELTEDPEKAFKALLESLDKQDDVASLGLAEECVMRLRPDFPQNQILDAKWRVRRDVCAIGFALARHRLDTGVFPPSLDRIAPDFGGAVPIDSFTGRPFSYKETPGGGIILYSWGENKKDDDGRMLPDQPRGDDVTIRIP